MDPGIFLNKEFLFLESLLNCSYSSTLLKIYLNREWVVVYSKCLPRQKGNPYPSVHFVTLQLPNSIKFLSTLNHPTCQSLKQHHFKKEGIKPQAMSIEAKNQPRDCKVGSCQSRLDPSPVNAPSRFPSPVEWCPRVVGLRWKVVHWHVASAIQ